MARTARQLQAMTGANSDDAREKDDYYPTPPDLVHALLKAETFEGPIWEPACGDGAMSRELEAKHTVFSSDLVARGYGESRRDFLWERMPDGCRNIVTNPPFKLAEQFWRRAFALQPDKIAFLCRLTWLESKGRAAMFKECPVSRVYVIPWRPMFTRGRLATADDGGSMLSYAWYVADRSHTGATTLHWLSQKMLGK